MAMPHVRPISSRRSDLLRVSGRAAAAVLTAVALLLTPALSAVSVAATISGVHLAAVTSSSFTVTLSSLGAGWTYRLYASTNKADIYYANLGRTPHRSSLSAKPRVTVGNLRYTAAPYWYRVQALKGSGHHTSDIFAVGLRPATPTALRATTLRGAISLTWTGKSSGFTVQAAEDAAFQSPVRSYTLRGGTSQLTPYGLTRGARYWFRVRSVNTGTASPYTTPVQATAGAPGRGVRVMTFNILTKDGDGARVAGGETVAPWSQRRLEAARYINASGPDVIGVQEGAAWIGPVRGPRQVDSLVSALGGAYALASTETPPDQPHYFRTGIYVLYKSASYAPVGAGGHWDLGTMPGGGERWAAYQMLRDRATGATFLFVSPHLYVVSGSSADTVRRSETASMIKQAEAYTAQRGGAPVVYAGDFNSHERHSLDGPAMAMGAAHVADALLVAQSRTNQQFNSANQYLRTPPALGLMIDHVYASPGVAVTAWRQALDLSGGRFVGVMASDHNPVVADLVIPG